MKTQRRLRGAGNARKAIGLVATLIATGCSTFDENLTLRGSPDPDSPTVHRFEIGRPLSASEVAQWDRDVRPDGTGLPPGAGTVRRGRTLYEKQCQHCHGSEGQGGPFDRLAGRIPDDAFPFAEDPTASKTIGSYWPYATTVFDYVRRAMPMERPGSLMDDEVYSLTAYLLFLNTLLDEEAELDAASLVGVRMPSQGRFVRDDRVGGEDLR